MATIRKRGEYSWEAQVRRKGIPAQTRTFEYRKDAEDWAHSVEVEMRRGMYLPRREAENTTLKDLADRFEKDFAPHHYRGMGWKTKLHHLRDKLGKYTLVALTPKLIGKYRDDRLTEPDARYKLDMENAPRVAPATVKGELDLLSKLLDVASKEFGITLPHGNPISGIRKPKGANARDRRLTAVEWANLMTECQASKNTWLATAVVLSVETAMRQGELLQLTWKKIDKKRKLALLLDPDKIKTQEPRAVPLSSIAIEALGCLPTTIHGRVIPISRMTLYKAFERACERASIVNYTWHDIRHEALSRLAERGDFSVLEIAAVSGHKTLQMLKRYTHLQAEKLAVKLG